MQGSVKESVQWVGGRDGLDAQLGNAGRGLREGHEDRGERSQRAAGRLLWGGGVWGLAKGGWSGNPRWSRVLQGSE